MRRYFSISRKYASLAIIFIICSLLSDEARASAGKQKMADLIEKRKNEEIKLQKSSASKAKEKSKAVVQSKSSVKAVDVSIDNQKGRSKTASIKQQKKEEPASSFIRPIFPSLNKEPNKYLDGNNYVRIKAGLYLPDTLGSEQGFPKGEPGYIAGFDVGRYINKHIALDLGYFYRSENEAMVSETTGSVRHRTWGSKSHVVMLSGNIFLPEIYNVRPYLKAGMGRSYNIASLNYAATQDSTTRYYRDGKNTWNNAWQVGFGINIPIFKNTDFEIEYVKADLGNIKTSNTYRTVTDANPTGTLTVSTPVIGKVVDNMFVINIKVKF
ncbi:MAG: outer membrane beta-barrel protein [Rickettsiales bacterium]